VLEAEVGKGRKEKLRVARHKRRLLFSCAVDVSGSMRGEPIKAAMATLADLYRTVMDDEDRFACCTFGSSVRKLHAAMPKRRVDLDQDLAHIEDNKGGATALWDGVAWAITAASMEYSNMKKAGIDDPPVIEVVIITDGKDNSSERRFAEIHELTKRPGVPNFNLIVVGLGSVDTDALNKLCEPKNCHFKHARDIPQFKRVLADVVDSIRLRLEVSSPSGNSVYDWQGRAKDAPAQLRALGRNGMSHVLQAADQAGRLEDIMSSLRITG
jgi:uncharacterized protein YegL